MLHFLLYHRSGKRCIRIDISNVVWVAIICLFYYDSSTKSEWFGLLLDVKGSVRLEESVWVLVYCHFPIHFVRTDVPFSWMRCNVWCCLSTWWHCPNRRHGNYAEIHQWQRCNETQPNADSQAAARFYRISLDAQTVESLFICESVASKFTINLFHVYRIIPEVSDLFQPMIVVVMSSSLVSICGILLMFQMELVQYRILFSIGQSFWIVNAI